MCVLKSCAEKKKIYIIHQARDDATSPTTTHTTNGTRHHMYTVCSHSPRDGWRRGVARRDVPPKRPRESRSSKCVSSSSACSEVRKGRGEGWRVRRLAETDATRPEEGGARCELESRESEYWSSVEREERGAQCCAVECGVREESGARLREDVLRKRS